MLMTKSLLDQGPSISSSRIKVLDNFTCSFEVKTSAIHKNIGLTTIQQQYIVVVNKINQSLFYKRPKKDSRPKIKVKTVSNY